MSKFVVTRQCYFGVDPEDMYMVEIAEGGIDYANPDAFSAKYPGEFEEFTDPREAVSVAIEIAKAWAYDQPSVIINIGEGYTMGMTMPFEGSEKEDLIAWAEDRYSKMEKCPTCGEIMEDTKEWWESGSYRHGEFLPNNDGEKYCSEHCAEKASTYECDGNCETYYFYKENKLEEVNGDWLCPECRAVPCVICGITREDHDEYELTPDTNDDEHEFEEA